MSFSFFFFTNIMSSSSGKKKNKGYRFFLRTAAFVPFYELVRGLCKDVFTMS